MQYRLKNIVAGGVIYATGDSVAALLTGEFMMSRLLGMALIGSTVYAFEIPNYFAWISGRLEHQKGFTASLKRTGLALLYFNPLWISRHLLFIRLISWDYASIDERLLTIGLFSFLLNIPVSIVANYVIQNRIHVQYRFISSAIFSGIMAIYYALSAQWFY